MAPVEGHLNSSGLPPKEFGSFGGFGAAVSPYPSEGPKVRFWIQDGGGGSSYPFCYRLGSGLVRGCLQVHRRLLRKSDDI